MSRSDEGPGGSDRVRRGGSWNNNASNLRVANRNDNDPDDSNNNIGFRPASSNHRLTGPLYGQGP